jgi:hypothetical protein
MSDLRAGDEQLRNAGIVLPCAKTFGFVGFRSPSLLYRCDRPYGHTGPHTAADVFMTGGRDAEDEDRTVTVLTRLLKGGEAS